MSLLLFLIYINDLDIGVVSKMSKFADDTKLCHRARNPDDIMELQEDINKLVEWANKWRANTRSGLTHSAGKKLEEWVNRLILLDVANSFIIKSELTDTIVLMHDLALV